MAVFISSQLDFILFFYGLAFILLGATCFAIVREGERGEPWAVLGLFGFAHGASEWLDLTALIIGDTSAFAVVRLAIMTGSFILLLEFARLEAIRFGLKMPGRLIYLPLVLLIVFVGRAGGLVAAGAVARYTIGFVAAMATSLVFAWHARGFSGTPRRWAIWAAVGFAFYGLAAGAIVPAAPFWPASVFNYDWFIHLTGIPIQLLRGLLACAMALSIWAIWGHQLILTVASPRYTAYLRRQFIWTLVAMATILVCGWVLTDFLGGIYKQNVQEAARGDIDLLASRLAGETALMESMVKVLAGAPSVPASLIGRGQQDLTRSQSMLDLDVDASGAKRGYILDRSGTIIASSDRSYAASGAKNERGSPYFQTSIAGRPSNHFAFDPMTMARDFYASYPIRTGNGTIVGVAVIVKSLDAFDADLKQFNRPYFFIDPDGVVVLTNRPQMLFRTLWPLSPEKRVALGRQFGMLNDRPMLSQEIVDATWTNVDGERNYVRRRYAHLSQWSLVILNPTREIFASRVLGIVITLLVTIMTLIYNFGRERWVHDSVQLDKRVQLQELARELRFRATTDPLTGLSNRSKFDQALASEMLRSERYRTPLSLVVYDVDNFKDVNDSCGHLVGDKVLIQLSRLVSNLVRSGDVLARWGGEEFAILFPGSDGQMAYQATEKLREAIARTAFEGIGTVTCSFGVAQYVDGDTTETFISRADEALYRAKVEGRNRVELAPPPAVAESGRNKTSYSI